MCVKIKKQNESFLQIFTNNTNIIEQIWNYFSFYAENYHFMPNYQNESWDGKIRLFNLKTYQLPIGLLKKLIHFLTKKQIKFEINKNEFKKIEITTKQITNFIKQERKLQNSNKIKSLYYQTKSLYIALQKNKSIIQSPTGSGKSYLIFLYIKFLLENNLNENGKVLIVVPKKSLVFQMRDEFENYQKNFSNNIHTIIGGSLKTSEKQIHVSTWQSIYNLPKFHFFQYKVLIVDECHHAKANSIRKITEKCINASFRLGTTATIENNNYKIIFKGNFGNIYEIEKTNDLIKKKILSNVIIHHIILKHPLETRIAIAALDYKNLNYETKLSLQNKNRYLYLISTIKNINKNCLILFKRISFGKKLYNDIKKSIDNKQIFYIDGKVKVKEREEIRKKMEIDNDIILIATHQIFSTGINIKNLHYIIITLFNKSKITVMQTIGRGLRKHENKDRINIIDFVDDMQLNAKEKKLFESEHKDIELHTRRNLLLQHFYDRIKIYKEEGFEYKIIRKEL